MDKLDAPPFIEKFGGAINLLACGKSPVVKGTLPNVIKIDKEVLSSTVTDFYISAGRKGVVPQDMQ